MSQLTTSFFATILKIEGGYQDIASDNGNYACGQLIGTNMGISAGALSTWWGRCPTVQEMKSLTQQQAFDFYAWYFDRYNLYQVNDQAFAELLMNNTMGSPTNAAKTEQRVLNKYGYNLTIDGDRGSATLAALNDGYARHGAKLYNDIRSAWIQYLKSINKPQFIDGWLIRMNKYFPAMDSTAVGSSALIALAFIVFLITRK